MKSETENARVMQAANPDWTPSDPSGSLYLTRMADIGLHRYPYYRQRHIPGAAGIHHGHHPDVMGTNLASGGSAPMDSSHMTERAQEYDHALRQSRMVTALRRRGGGAGSGTGLVGAGSVMNMSTLLATGPPIGASVFVDPANAPSVTLGDSHHASEETPAKTGDSISKEMPGSASGPIHPEDLAPDGGVGSGLGESYVDGARRYGVGREDEHEDGIEDGGGVLELLAQIYGRRDAPSVGF